MSAQVQQMFASIAPRYDLVNGLMSFGMHRLWRRRAVELSRVTRGDRVLDCATGTGDLALAFKRAVGREGKVVGTDFCAEMLERAPAKARAQGVDVTFEVADVTQLPYADASFDAACIAFGIRNVDEPLRGLRELGRVVRPGGRVVVLELGQPTGSFGALYRLYSRLVIPALGAALTDNAEAYRYLPRTAAAFPSGERFLALMAEAGVFAQSEAHPLTFGTAYVYVGTRRAPNQ